MRGKGCALVLAVSMLATLAANTATAAWEHTREGWMIGFSVGGGTAKGEFDTDADAVVSSERTGGVAFSLRGGYAVRPDLVLGLEGNGWGRSETTTVSGFGNVDATTTLNVGVASLTWFPGAGGFFLRGGLGFGGLHQEVKSGGVTVSYDDNGFGLLLATGFEFRLTRRFALGPQVDFGWMDIGTVDVEDDTGNIVQADVSFNYVTFSVLFNWYF